MGALQHGRQKSITAEAIPTPLKKTRLIHYDDIRFGNVVMRPQLIELESSLHGVSHRGCKRLAIA
jgi:hypothetical protein